MNETLLLYPFTRADVAQPGSAGGRRAGDGRGAGDAAVGGEGEVT